MTLVDRCSTCGSLWRVHPLSAPRQTCAGCDAWVCGNCLRAQCAKCFALIHQRCAHLIGEDLFCEACWTATLREALKGKSSGDGLIDVLAASVKWAEEKRK